jgi:preprotein translocase subunit YajC
VTNELFFMLQQGTPGGGIGAVVPLLLMFVVFYFFLIRPQNKRQKQHQDMLVRLKKGDVIVLSGGVVGTIHSVADSEFMVEIAEKTRVKVIRAQVSGVYQNAETTEEKEKS